MCLSFGKQVSSFHNLQYTAARARWSECSYHLPSRYVAKAHLGGCYFLFVKQIRSAAHWGERSFRFASRLHVYEPNLSSPSSLPRPHLPRLLSRWLWASCSAQVAPAQMALRRCEWLRASDSAQMALCKLVCENWSAQVALLNFCVTDSAQIVLCHLVEKFYPTCSVQVGLHKWLCAT